MGAAVAAKHSIWMMCSVLGMIGLLVVISVSIHTEPIIDEASFNSVEPIELRYHRWLRDRGVTFDERVQIQSHTHGVSLYALGPIKRGETLVYESDFISHQSLIHLHHLCNDLHLSHDDTLLSKCNELQYRDPIRNSIVAEYQHQSEHQFEHQFEHQSDNQYRSISNEMHMIWFMSEHHAAIRSRGSSNWGPFFEALPLKFQNSLSVSHSIWSKLPSSPFKQRVTNLREYLSQCFSRIQSILFIKDSVGFPSESFGEQQYEWAYGVMQNAMLWSDWSIDTNRHSISSNQKRDASSTTTTTNNQRCSSNVDIDPIDFSFEYISPLSALVIDTRYPFNNARMVFDSNSNRRVLRATRDIPAGAPINPLDEWHSQRNNEDLAFTYGFVVFDHPNDCIPLRMQIVNSFWHIAVHSMWSESSNSLEEQCICLRPIADVSDEAVVFARFFTLDANSIERAHRLLMRHSISLENEFAASRLLLEALSDLANYFDQYEHVEQQIAPSDAMKRYRKEMRRSMDKATTAIVKRWRTILRDPDGLYETWWNSTSVRNPSVINNHALYR